MAYALESTWVFVSNEGKVSFPGRVRIAINRVDEGAMAELKSLLSTTMLDSMTMRTAYEVLLKLTKFKALRGGGRRQALII